MERHPRPWWHRPGTRAAVLGGGNARANLNRILKYELGAVANYRADLGVTGTLNASAIANQIGIAGPLLQATGANQPIHLAYSGEKYAYLPGVAGNVYTAPNQVVTGSRTFTFSIALNDYTPAADVTLFSKTSANDGFQIKWLTTDKVRLIIGDGATLTNVDVVAASAFTDATQHTVSIVWVDGVGATFFYDGVQSGVQVAAAKTLTNAAVVLTIGSTTSIGKLYSFTVSGLYGFDASLWSETTTNAATALGAFSETWTQTNTGTKLAQIVGSSQLLFPGDAAFMKAAPFTLNQPEAVILVASQVTWTSGDYLFDGNATNGGASAQVGVSPAIVLGAGGVNISNSDLAVNRYGIAVFGINAASSFVQINNNAQTTGNPGANNMGGFTLGANAAGATQGNLQAKEAILLNAVPSAAKLAQIISLLNSIHTVF